MSSPTLLSFPPELIEQILVSCASHGFPGTIASLSATCRTFHEMVTNAGDSHLWREVFLAVFDDPRGIGGLVSAATRMDGGGVFVDWKKEFQGRVRAGKVFRSLFEKRREVDADPKLLEQTLTSILSVISTIAPFLPHTPVSANTTWLHNLFSNGFPDVLLERLLGQTPSSDWERTEAGKAFYKLFFLAGFPPSSRSDSSANGSSSTRYNLRSSTKKNGPETGRLSEAKQTALARNVARRRVYRLPYLSEERCWGPFLPLGSGEEGDEEEEGDDEMDEEERARVEDEHDGKEEEGSARTTRKSTSTSTSTSITLIDDSDPDDVSTSFIRAMLSNFEVYFDQEQGVVVGVGGEDSDDEEYVPHHSDSDSDTESTTPNSTLPTPPTTSSSSSSSPPTYPLYPHLLIPDYTFLSAARLVVAENLRERYVEHIRRSGLEAGGGGGEAEAVWPWFTSAEAVGGTGEILRRMGVMGEGEGESESDGGGGWQSLRFGSSSAFWGGVGCGDGWGVRDAVESEGGQVEEGDTPPFWWKREEGLEYVDGWDWAGAEGRWMRAVCWMDYRDLLFHNLQSTYARLTNYTQEIQETCRVFPMTLKIVAYSRVRMPEGLPPPPSSVSSTCPDGKTKGKKGKGKGCKARGNAGASMEYDPLVYALPVIHIVGEFRGSDVDAHVQRCARGTVRMVGGGAVRWNLISSEVNTPERDEWVMEGVQVGGIGSLMGVVGMWTGAEHERGDPIGPSWAWKME